MKLLLRTTAVIFLLILTIGLAFYWNPLWFNDQQIRYHLYQSRVRSEYVTVNGHRYHFFESQPPDDSPGIPLILIHGLGSRGEDWSPMIPTLAAKGFHVYAPDLLGYGRSSKPDIPYTIPLEVNAVAEFIQAVGLNHADVDGWSMGGWIAAELALDHPAMVDRLVLDDAAGLKYQPSFARDVFVPTDSAGLSRLLALLTPKPMPLPPFIVRATLRKVANSGKIVQSSLDFMESGADLLDNRLPQIKQPTLIVWGTRDDLIPMSLGRQMHREIPHSVFLGIEGCGHLAPGECAKPVLAGTIAFLQASPPLPPGEHTLPGH